MRTSALPTASSALPMRSITPWGGMFFVEGNAQQKHLIPDGASPPEISCNEDRCVTLPTSAEAGYRSHRQRRSLRYLKKSALPTASWRSRWGVSLRGEECFLLREMHNKNILFPMGQAHRRSPATKIVALPQKLL
jgi:hypothetical protein